MSVSDNSKRIAKNSVALYFQMLLSMLVGLYTSRVILNALGVDDFGLFNVVGGVVAMFGLLNSAMSSSTSRFLTFELGAGDQSRLKTVFTTSLITHLLIAFLVCLLAETIGLWFMSTQMQIAPERMEAAYWVFHLMIAGTFLSILSVRYGASIIAHEKMSIYAYFSILDVTFKLIIVFLLQAIDFDKLKVYAVLLLAVQVIMQGIYMIYCLRHFEETRLSRSDFKCDKPLLKEMTSFAGWSLFGDSAFLMFTQGVNILLNIFFGTAVNAARGIAVQVQGVLMRFISNFQTAINPQITKSYASNDFAYMHKLIYASSKYSFFMLLILSLPVFFEAENILRWWLKIVPDHTVNFIRIILLISLIDSLANPLITSAKATGRIKLYQSVLGSILLLIVPLSYVALKLGYPPESVFFVHLFIVTIGHLIRVLLIKPLIALSAREYTKQVVLRSGFVLLLAPALPLVCINLVTDTITRFILVCTVSVLSTVGLIYLWGMNSYEKELMHKIISNQWNKFKK